MDWKVLLSVLDRKFNADRCLERVGRIYETDHWFSFDKFEQTASYCADSMKNAGLEQIEVLPLKADGKSVYGDWGFPKAWHANSATLHFADGELIADYSKMPCSLVMSTPPTPPVEAEVVDITGLAEMPCDGSLKGKILLSDLAPAEARKRAVQVGAIGILSDRIRLFPGVRDRREDLYDHCLWEGIGKQDDGYSVFGFKLTPRQGDRIRQMLRNGPVKVVAQIDTEFYDGVCPTVSGALMGTDPDEPEVFAYAHLYEPGANDNASGSAALLELAECFQEAIEEGLLPRPRRNIRFAMGRECGGSMGYVCSHPERKMLCGGVFDMVGTERIDNARLSIRYDPIANWSFADAAIAASDRICAEYTGKVHDFCHNHFKKGLGTDNIIADPAFGVPSVAMVASPALSYHSSMDSPDRIEPEILKRNALILGVYLYGLADADENTCAFLEKEIRMQMQKQQTKDLHPRKHQHLTEAMERALHSLTKISDTVYYPAPAESQLPMPEWAEEAGKRIPVRLVPGCLTLAKYPAKKPRWKPAWNAELNIPLFWADGKRNLWQIAVQTALELDLCTDGEIEKKFRDTLDYFDFLAELGYLSWK